MPRLTLMATLALGVLVGCTGEIGGEATATPESTATPGEAGAAASPTGSPLEGALLDEIMNEPELYLDRGELTTVVQVAEVAEAGSFFRAAASGGDVLVVAESLPDGIAEGDELEVTGEFMRYNPATLGEDIEFAVDEAEIAEFFSGDHLIVAARVEPTE